MLPGIEFGSSECDAPGLTRSSAGMWGDISNMDQRRQKRSPTTSADIERAPLASNPAKVEPPKRGGRGISKGLNRDAILIEASNLLAQTGVAGFRVQDLAAALGVQPSAIYNHFDGREDLLAELATRVSVWMVEFTAPPATAGPREKLIHIVRRLAKLFYRDPLYARLQLHDIADRAVLSRGESRDLNRYSRERLIGILRDGVKQGVFRPVDIDTLRVILLAGTAAALLWHEYDDLPERRSLSDMQDELVDLVLRYVSI